MIEYIYSETLLEIYGSHCVWGIGRGVFVGVNVGSFWGDTQRPGGSPHSLMCKDSNPNGTTNGNYLQICTEGVSP